MDLASLSFLTFFPFDLLFPCTKSCIQVEDVAFKNEAIRPSQVRKDTIQMNSALPSQWFIVLLYFCWLVFYSVLDPSSGPDES